MFYLNPNIQLSLPSTGRISLLHQEHLSRYVLHLLYSSPIKRGDCSVIEDFPELLDIKVQYDFSDNIKKIYTIPEDLELKMVQEKGQDFVILPKLKCHSGIVFEY